MTTAKLATLVALALWLPGGSTAAEISEAPEEIVVTGRLPGPPLWKVSNGDKVLWIFPHLSWIPKDMIWDSQRVARVIAESQEFLNGPEVHAGPPRSALLNPINIVRGGRLMDQLEGNPDGGTLEENLPPALYARFAALQARYFPQNAAILEMRPLKASELMINIIRRREELVAGDDILKTIRRLVRRNRNIKRTEISMRVDIGDSYGEFAARAEAWVQGLPRELEQACFEQRVRHVEEDLDHMKSLANSWAQGNIDEFRNEEFYNVALVFDGLSACADLSMGSTSTERQTLGDLVTRVKQVWLDAAENALTTNTSTFAILPVSELLAADGLLNQLEAKGYEIKEP